MKKFGVSVQIFHYNKDCDNIMKAVIYQYITISLCVLTSDDVVDAVFTFLVYGGPISGAV